MNLSVTTYGYEHWSLTPRGDFCPQYLDHTLVSGMMISEKLIGKDFEYAVMT
jgi:hypothetical protein